MKANLKVCWKCPHMSRFHTSGRPLYQCHFIDDEALSNFKKQVFMPNLRGQLKTIAYVNSNYKMVYFDDVPNYCEMMDEQLYNMDEQK